MPVYVKWNDGSWFVSIWYSWLYSMFKKCTWWEILPFWNNSWVGRSRLFYSFKYWVVLGVYLECMFLTGVNDDVLVNCFSMDKKMYDTKKRARKYWVTYLPQMNQNQFFGDGNGSIGALLGSHSLWKCAITHTRRTGCSCGEIGLRGSLKRHKRQVDTYIDTSAPY